MQLKVLGFGASVTLAVATLMSISSPAQAIIFGNGDTLNITGGYSTTLATPFRFTFKNVSNTIPNGGFGNFGVVSGTTTGGFANFITNGVIVNEYKIADLDFTNTAVGNIPDFDFLTLTKTVTGAPGTPAAGGPNDSFKFVMTELLDKTFVNNPGPLATTNLQFNGKFVNAQTNEAVAAGIFTGNFTDSTGAGSFSGTLIVEMVEKVPEPSAVLGLGAVVGLGAFAKRHKITKG